MPDPITFTKMQGIGNDFVVVDARNISGRDWPALAEQVCERRTGIGADGLLVLENTALADVMMRMYNPDGTPDVCGNGMRCIAKYILERSPHRGDHLRIQTFAGLREAAVEARDADGRIVLVRVGMGEPRFDPPSIPMLVSTPEAVDLPLDLGGGRTLRISALSTGSTHAVTFVGALPEDPRFLTISPLVEHHPLFAEKTSLMWCRPASDTRLELRIWERGAGETLGCGTGACAAAVAAIRLGYAEEGAPITVSSKGGDLSISWTAGHEIQMIGPAEYVFEGVYR